MLQLPFINTRLHLHPMLELYDAYAALYNADINAKRANDPENKKDYQTLKATHRATFKDLIFETGKRMLQNINRYQSINTEQGNNGTFSLLRANTQRICGTDYYSCSTSRLQMKKHSGKELSTIYRNLRRLMDAGIISDKINHGHFMYFELHIRAEFLLVSDKANPYYNPLEKSAETAPQKAFSLYSQIAFCKGKEEVKEHLINKLYSEADKNISTDHHNCSSSAGTSTRTTDSSKAMPQTAQGIRPENKARGRAFAAKELENRGQKVDNLNLITKKDLKKWHTFHRLAYSAYFVDYLIDTIYTRRNIEIFPDARRNLIEYAERFYFPNPQEPEPSIYKPCLTIEDYNQRLARLIWRINAANRHQLKHPEKFFPMPKFYIDIDEKNGFTGTQEWLRNSLKLASEREKHIKNAKDLEKLHAKIRELAEGKTTLVEAENYIENHLQKYKYVFRHSLVTVINEIETK